MQPQPVLWGLNLVLLDHSPQGIAGASSTLQGPLTSPGQGLGRALDRLVSRLSGMLGFRPAEARSLGWQGILPPHPRQAHSHTLTVCTLLTHRQGHSYTFTAFMRSELTIRFVNLY